MIKLSLVLYSAVGGTDPISNNHDGSLLHICRHYQPDKVYLLISMEMGMFQAQDQRYTYCIEQLGLMLDHKFEVVLINEDDLERPDSFDIVYPIIKRDLLRIKSEINKEDKLIVNIASGTPAMKYCLQFLSALDGYDFTPISVTTPQRSLNPHKEDHYSYNVEEEWNNNKDNNPEHRNRTYETKSVPMLSVFYKHTIIKFIEEYNYSAALTFAETLSKESTVFSDDFLKILDAADTRLKFDILQAQTKLRECGFNLPYPNTNRQIFEYYLNLKIKLHKQEYADFIRATTALITELLELSLAHCGININDYITTNRDNVSFWDEDKLQNTEIESILLSQFPKFNYGIVSDSHLRKLANEFLSREQRNSSLYKDIVVLGFFEETVRNPTTHEMVSANPEEIKKYTKKKWKENKCSGLYGFDLVDGITPGGVLTRIEKVLPPLGISINKKNSYDEMNALILSKLQ